MSLWTGFGVLFLVTGCSPSGPDDLLAGKRLLDQGRPASAVRKLREAVLLMPTNAMAWAYLGLAYHQVGSSSNAVEAYTKALGLSPDLPEVRFDLGCLWMQERRWTPARQQLTAAVQLQKNSAIIWQQLGVTEVRLGDYNSAERSLREASRLDQACPETWNWLGVAQVQQGRIQDATHSFQVALHLQANHGPAILNLAIVTQEQLSNPRKALELYQQYLAFQPNAPNAGAVRRLTDRLEHGLQSDSNSATAMRDLEPKPLEASQTKADVLTAQARLGTNRETRPETTHSAELPPSPATLQMKPAAEHTPEAGKLTRPSPSASSASRGDVLSPVTLSDERPAVRGPAASNEPRVTSREPPGPEPSAKRGFFAKINPLNLFKRKPSEKRPTPLSMLADSGEQSAATNLVRPGSEPKGWPTTTVAKVDGANIGRFEHYVYQFRESPRKGDSRSAERAFLRADRLQARGSGSEAIQAYMDALRADPAYFAARFNLGLLYLHSGEVSKALPEFEAATRIQPDSVPARYDFALALKWADFPVESANELQSLLTHDPDDARAHLTLGNLYAQRLGDNKKAREHYARVLELNPGHPQASAIRLWLAQNSP